MEMDMYMIGIVVGLLAVFLLFFVVILLLRKPDVGGGFFEKSYDERQQRARAISFKSGFFTVLICNALYALSAALLGKPFCDVPTGCFLGICLGVTVFAVVSIMRDAYIPVKDTLRRYVILFAVIGGVNALSALRYLLDPEESMIVDGVLTFRCMNLIVTLMLVVILTAMLIKRGLDKREEAEE